jgi:hypothetical protein
MIIGIIFIIVIASALYFFDDFPKWIESGKKFWNDIPVLYDRNIRTKPKVKRNVSQEEVQREQLKIQMQQMQEAKKGFQEILESRNKLGSTFENKLNKFESQIKSKTKSVKGQRATDWERKYLWDGISRRKRVPCIHCEMDEMYKGPNDGPSQVWRCPTCGQGIKLTFYANTMAGFQCENLGINSGWKKY